jgi:hypothetical protein
MYSDTGDTTSLVPGFPIRTSSDPRSVGSSPRHIAASHVLHRLLMPRHPPCALKHLQTQKNKLNKTCSNNQHFLLKMLATTIQLNKHHTPPPRWSDTTQPDPTARTTQVLPQDPTVCLAEMLPSKEGESCCAPAGSPTTGAGTEYPNHTDPTRCGGGGMKWCSLERR